METFVVRAWVPTDLDPTAAGSQLHGFVEHAGFDRAQPFQSTDELVVLIRAAAAPAVGSPWRSPKGMEKRSPSA